MAGTANKAIGFYWTLPVPWAGFTHLPGDVDEAANSSRTIRYQRDLTRKHAKDEGYDLVREVVFLEIQFDRSSEYVQAPLNKIAPYVREKGATLLFVDFSYVQNWRSNTFIDKWAEGASVRVEQVYPDTILIDDEMFDPFVHFSAWRDEQRRWQAGKHDRIRIAKCRAEALKRDGFTSQQIADRLNEDGIRTGTGIPWTRENVMKLMVRTGKENR